VTGRRSLLLCPHRYRNLLLVPNIEGRDPRRSGDGVQDIGSDYYQGGPIESRSGSIITSLPYFPALRGGVCSGGDFYPMPAGRVLLRVFRVLNPSARPHRTRAHRRAITQTAGGRSSHPAPSELFQRTASLPTLFRLGKRSDRLPAGSPFFPQQR